MVGQGDGELARARRRIEVRLEEPLQRSQCLIGPVEQSLGERSQLVLAADAHEQLVVEAATQPGERVARRRLGEADDLPGSGDVALAEKRGARAG